MQSQTPFLSCPLAPTREVQPNVFLTELPAPPQEQVLSCAAQERIKSTTVTTIARSYQNNEHQGTAPQPIITNVMLDEHTPMCAIDDSFGHTEMENDAI
jgi:hypothetical protein